jgi:hypothetical protein
MKKILSLFKVKGSKFKVQSLFGLALLVSAFSLQPSAYGQDNFGTASFGITNNLAGATGYIVAPANTAANITGHALDISSYGEVGFWFHGQGSVTNLGTLKVAVGYATPLTGAYPLATDWTRLLSTTNTTAPECIFLTIPLDGTNMVNWSTNLDRYALAGAQWLGVEWLTNSMSTGNLTNATMGITKKRIPIAYP